MLLKMKNIDSYNGLNCDIKGNLINSCIGDNVYIGEKSKLESVVVYNNSKIENNVVLNNCVIGENCKIGSSSNIKDTIIGDNETTKDNISIDKEVIWTQPIPEGYPNKQIGNVIRE